MKKTLPTSVGIVKPGGGSVKNKWVYCRGCNREVLVDEVMKSEYIERSKKYGTLRHPICDCDEIIVHLRKPSDDGPNGRKCSPKKKVSR